MKFSKLYFALPFLLVAVKVLAEEGPCQNIKTQIYEKSVYTTPPFTIQGKTLKTLGFSFELKKSSSWLPIVDQETPFNVLLYKSPDQKKAVLSLGAGQTRDPDRDLWLIDFEHNKTDLLDQSGGSFTDVIWHSNQIFEIRWGGQGYDISVLVKLGKTLLEQRIDDLLDVDFKRGVYAAFSRNTHLGLDNDRLEIGRLFMKDVPTEEFKLPPVGASYSAWVTNVEIQGDQVSVCFDDIENGEKIERLVFHPKMLK